MWIGNGIFFGKGGDNWKIIFLLAMLGMSERQTVSQCPILSVFKAKTFFKNNFISLKL